VKMNLKPKFVTIYRVHCY